MESKNLSRRSFLTSAAAGGAALAGSDAQVAAGQAGSNPDTVYDVVIVGAGISGLVTARELAKRGVDNVLVLEARDRVGGRVVNHDIGKGCVAEGGGQWIGPTQTAILELCEELGVGTFPTHLEGDVLLSLGGDPLKVPYEFTRSEESELSRTIDRLAMSVPLDRPWEADSALEWDSMSVADWAAKQDLSQQDQFLIQLITGLSFATTPEQLSFLYFLYLIHSGGGILPLGEMKGGAQESRIEGGSQILALKMAEALSEKVRLSTPVRRIEHEDELVMLHTDAGLIRAHEVVMALMPGSCSRISFTPNLPHAREQLQHRWIQHGTGIKFNVVYETPFWREQGLSGMSISASGPTPFTTDNSPPDSSMGVILVLTTRETVDPNPEKHREQITASLAKLFGEEARAPIGFHVLDWSVEEWTSGCVSPLEPGVITRYGHALRPSVGRIHWGGTEVAEVWTGYMDGAIRAGRTLAENLASKRSV